MIDIKQCAQKAAEVICDDWLNIECEARDLYDRGPDAERACIIQQIGAHILEAFGETP